MNNEHISIKPQKENPLSRIELEQIVIGTFIRNPELIEISENEFLNSEVFTSELHIRIYILLIDMYLCFREVGGYKITLESVIEASLYADIVLDKPIFDSVTKASDYLLKIYELSYDTNNCGFPLALLETLAEIFGEKLAVRLKRIPL